MDGADSCHSSCLLDLNGPADEDASCLSLEVHWEPDADVPTDCRLQQPVELHHTGRRWAPRSTLLTSPILEPERVGLVASKGGHSDHPDWYKNLVANPDVELVVDGERRVVRARTADVDERAELWPQIVSVNRGYTAYQRNTDREIPVVILERDDRRSG